jgi:uncharacterized protein YxjI
MSTGTQLSGARYVVRQQLYTVHQNFEVFDASGTKIMSAHGNGLRVMDRIEMKDASGKVLLELRERAGKRPKVNVMSKGKKLLSVGERRVGIRDHFVIDTPLPAKFEIVGNAWKGRFVPRRRRLREGTPNPVRRRPCGRHPCAQGKALSTHELARPVMISAREYGRDA